MPNSHPANNYSKPGLRKTCENGKFEINPITSTFEVHLRPYYTIIYKRMYTNIVPNIYWEIEFIEFYNCSFS